MSKHICAMTKSCPAPADADDKGRIIATCGPLKLLTGKCPTAV